MATSPTADIRYPVPTDAAAIATYFQNMALDVDKQVVRKFSNQAARDGKFANPNAPVNGDTCTVGGVLMVYRGGAWRTIFDDAASPWVSLTMSTGFLAWYQAPQARVFNGFVELRGMVRAAALLGTTVANLTDGSGPGAAIIAQVSSAYTGGPRDSALGMDGSFNPTDANVLINARTDGGLRIYASASAQVQYIGLEHTRFPLT